MTHDDTPTPRTDENAQWANSCSFEKKLQMKVCELWFAKTLERELNAVTEKRDGLREGILYASDQLTKITEQRDRLAEALRKAISWGDSASHHILHRQNINWTYLNEAKEALQCLNKSTEETK